MAQNNGGKRQQQQGQQEVMTDNEVVSARDNLAQVLAALNHRQAEIAAVLPNDVSFAAFSASVNQALRNNPKLLRCTTSSLVNACVKAAYDGLKIDGKEAAIVDAQERYQDGNVWKSRTVARYMPMVFGLIKQILQSGQVLDVKAVIVYAAEVDTGRFLLREGTNPGIDHEPILSGDKGSMIGAYSIALLKNGVRTFEWMDAAAILDVKKEAKTGKVWDRWPTEMWKKTVVRRHRKTLPSTRDIVDMEAREMFPQFDRSEPHPAFAGIGHNQQTSMAGPRPTRSAIGYDAQSAGVPLDMGGRFDSRDEDMAMQGRDDQQQERQQTQERHEDQQQDQQREAEVVLPEDAQGWAVWAEGLEIELAKAADGAELDMIWAGDSVYLAAAPKALKDRLTAIMTDRNADLALAAAGKDD